MFFAFLCIHYEHINVYIFVVSFNFWALFSFVMPLLLTLAVQRNDVVDIRFSVCLPPFLGRAHWSIIIAKYHKEYSTQFSSFLSFRSLQFTQITANTLLHRATIFNAISYNKLSNKVKSTCVYHTHKKKKTLTFSSLKVSNKVVSLEDWTTYLSLFYKRRNDKLLFMWPFEPEFIYYFQTDNFEFFVIQDENKYDEFCLKLCTQ